MSSSFIYAEDLSLEQAIQRPETKLPKCCQRKAQASESSYKASLVNIFLKLNGRKVYSS
jgi:hypothetical protein